MTGPIRDTTGERLHDVFIESPTRPNKTAYEVYVGNASDISGGGGDASTETKLAAEAISALKCVTSESPTDVSIAASDITFEKATVLGVAFTGAATGSSLKVKTYGKLNDSTFNWPVNTQLYLSETGSLTDVAPTTGFRTLVATSNGPNEIFINIQEPIIL